MAPACCQGWCEDEMRKCLNVPWVSSVQLLSCVQLFATPWTAARQASLSITNSSSLFKLMSFELVTLSNHLILCRPLLPSIFPSTRVFSDESVLCIRWPKYWSFSFSISPSNEYSVLISFRIDCFAILAVQETLCQLGPSEILAFLCKCTCRNVAVEFSFSPCSRQIYILKIFFSFFVLRVTKSHGELGSIQSLVKVNIFTWKRKKRPSLKIRYLEKRARAKFGESTGRRPEGL